MDGVGAAGQQTTTTIDGAGIRCHQDQTTATSPPLVPTTPTPTPTPFLRRRTTEEQLVQRLISKLPIDSKVDRATAEWFLRDRYLDVEKVEKPRVPLGLPRARAALGCHSISATSRWCANPLRAGLRPLNLQTTPENTLTFDPPNNKTSLCLCSIGRGEGAGQDHCADALAALVRELGAAGRHDAGGVDPQRLSAQRARRAESARCRGSGAAPLAADAQADRKQKGEQIHAAASHRPIGLGFVRSGLTSVVCHHRSVSASLI